MRLRGLSGWIGPRRAVLGRDGRDRLVLRWRGRDFDLDRAIVRHRDDDGRVTFTVHEPGGVGLGARYQRRLPRLRDVLLDELDPTCDEPWTWEDRDFGLRVFNISTGLGPVKYRHRIAATDPWRTGQWELTVSESDIRRECPGFRTQHVRLAEVNEVRAKFELGGAWSPWAILVLHAPGDFVTVPLEFDRDVERARSELLPRLQRLPGWGDEADAAFQDACRWGLRQPDPEGEYLSSRAERPVWKVP